MNFHNPERHHHQRDTTTNNDIYASILMSMGSNILGLRQCYGAATGLRDSSSPICPHFLPSLPTAYITFRHPGYPDPGNILCRLPTYDGLVSEQGAGTDDDEDPAVWGLHYGTALQACSIIACNAKGFLSATILGVDAQPDTPLDWDFLLPAKVYYFYSSAWIASRDPADLVYPVCPGFQDWQFPHGLLPKEWVSVYKTKQLAQRVPAPSQYSAAVLLRDGSCRVSNFDDCTDIAHVVPKREYGWFIRNEMEVYNRNTKLPSSLITSDIENLLCLRTDIHMQLDSGNLVFVPKANTSRVHFLTETRQYGPMLHNRETEQFRIAPEFLYARFAWAVLPLAQTFAEKSGVKIRVWSAQQSTWEDKVNPTEEAAPARKRPCLEQRGSKGAFGTRSASKDLSGNTSAQDHPSDRASPNNRACPLSDSQDHPSTPPARRPSPTSHHSSPSPTWTPRPGYERRMKIFDGIVSRDPDSAWESLYWHPDAERLEVMKDAYLKAHEPLHGSEIKRQVGILKRGYALDDGEAVWGSQNASDVMLEDDSE